MFKNFDLNTATEHELTRIEGIGKDLAKKIVDYRSQHGPFQGWEDLMLIPGVPDYMLGTLKRHGCTVGDKAA